MSRRRAVHALNGASEEFACGLTWVPGELLDAIVERGASSDRTQALAECATSLMVDLAFTSMGPSGNYDAVEALHAADVAAVWVVDGVFSRVAAKRGWAEALRMTAAEPGSLASPLDEALHEALVEVRDAIESDADAVLIADDLAGPAGPLLAPDFALDALIPCYHRLALEATAQARPPAFHSDGDVRVLLPALARAGFSAVHLAGLAADAFEASARAAVASGLAVLGGISVQSLPADPRAAGERAASAVAAIGGIIVCDDGGITTLEEVAALGVALEAARQQRRR